MQYFKNVKLLYTQNGEVDNALFLSINAYNFNCIWHTHYELATVPDIEKDKKKKKIRLNRDGALYDDNARRVFSIIFILST